MSVACWDGQALAVDSRRITTRKGSVTGSTFKKNISNDSVKLTIPKEQVLFRREEVLVVARVGKVSLTRHMIDTLMEGRDLEIFYTGQIAKNKLEIKGSGTLLIVTKQGAWQFQITRKREVLVTFVGNQAWAIGAGAKTAVYLMQTLHLSPEHAVSGVILGHSSCGGIIRVWRRSHGADRVEHIPDMSPNDRRMRLLCDGMRGVKFGDF